MKSDPLDQFVPAARPIFFVAAGNLPSRAGRVDPDGIQIARSFSFVDRSSFFIRVTLGSTLGGLTSGFVDIDVRTRIIDAFSPGHGAREHL